MMIAYEGIDRNFKFLVLEVRRQLEITQQLCATAADELVHLVVSRDNYTDTLKCLIEKKCVSYFRNTPDVDRTSANLATALSVATSNLERIADFCVNIATQVKNLADVQLLMRFDLKPYFDELLAAVPMISDALQNADAALALRLCQAEAALDTLYKRDYELIREALRSGHDTDDLLRCLYVVHYLERMGDSLENIGEASLFAATGEKLKLHEYLRLKETLRPNGSGEPAREVSISFDWETRSGNRIAKIANSAAGPGELAAIFKKGRVEKMRNERANLARWEALSPGITPRVLEFREGDDDGALLLEFLDGLTLRDLVLNGDDGQVDCAMDAVEETLRDVWTRTRVDGAVTAGYLRQALERLPDVFRLHPDFAQGDFQVGRVQVDSIEGLLRRAAELEAHLTAPFSVLIHGDFNADNVIYRHVDRRVHFIDVHRSRESDYVQDVSVFFVSHFRIPVFEGHVRDTLNALIRRFFKFVEIFARERDDPTFHARLALGLARSFITSTRFEIDPNFAKVMYMRAVYLLEKLIDKGPERVGRMSLSADVLTY